MNLRSAARGCLAFLLLLSAPALQGDNDWRVTYTSRNVCALRGSTVNISCSYEYPDNIEQRSSTVLKTRWFTKQDRNQQIDIRSATDYKGRAKYSCGDKNCTASRCSGECTLTIKDLRQSDSAEYQFRIIKQPDWGYSGNPGVKLTVTDLQAFIHSDKPTLLDLECQSICNLAKPTYKWFRNGENAGRGKFYRGIVNSEDSYACAVEGFERFHSPSVSLQGDNDWTVTYSSSNVCALRGSTVNISYSYEYPYHEQHCYTTVLETLWFTKEDRNQTVDIGSDTDYERRVEYSCRDERHTRAKCYGTCILTIKDLRQSDSAEYQFRIITEQPDRGYTVNHGVNLTVTDLQVKLVFLHSEKPTLLDLECHSICSPAKPTYNWFRNGENAGPGKYYRGIVNSEDSYACAVEGFERFHSPSMYAPKTPSVTVSPSGEIEEGSSVTLSCSSDANPAAKYNWFKEHEDSVKESGQNYTITNITSELGGHYYCQAHNAIGHHNSTWLSVNVTESSSPSPSPVPPSPFSSLITAAVGTVAVFLATILLLVFLWLRMRASRKACEQGGRPDTTEEGDAIEQQYAVINFTRSETQDVPHWLAGSHVQSDQTEQVLYSAVNFQRPNTVPEYSEQTETGETSELYSAVQITPRV
ncbi:unnamed protein product [Lota lota]